MLLRSRRDKKTEEAVAQDAEPGRGLAAAESGGSTQGACDIVSKHSSSRFLTDHLASMTTPSSSAVRSGFLELPREVRDMMYRYACPYKWVDICQMPELLKQPNASRLCRQTRRESLDIFYGEGNWLIDLRGWTKAYPKSWSTHDIFTNWIAALGDENAARLRRLIFYHNNFTITYSINNKSNPRIDYTMRRNRSFEYELALDAPSGYTIEQAFRHAENHLIVCLEALNILTAGRPLSVTDIMDLFQIIEEFKPGLCSRNGIAWKDAILKENPHEQPDFHAHFQACGECAFHRGPNRTRLYCRPRPSTMFLARNTGSQGVLGIEVPNQSREISDHDIIPTQSGEN